MQAWIDFGPSFLLSWQDLLMVMAPASTKLASPQISQKCSQMGH